LITKKRIIKMKTENTSTSNSIYYVIPAVLCGVLTACVVSGTTFHMVLGAVFGLLSAGFWINVVQKNEEA
jgi:hypothetical protein